MDAKEGIPIIYSNSVKMAMSNYDFMLEFGLNIPAIDPKTKKAVANIARLATIAMSPQHFKVFVRVATKQLETYEKNFGEITIDKPKRKKKS